jgi:thiol:disulfide interchange protein
LTRDEPGSHAAKAKERFNIRGVPTIMFFDATGNEVPALRLEEFEVPDLFLERLKKGELTPKTGSPAV